MIFSKWSKFALVICLSAFAFNTTPANAQGVIDGVIGSGDSTPQIQNQADNPQYADHAHTHPAIKMTPDKSELVRLDSAAASIIIGNPNHLSILADTSKTLVLVARAPGATHFTILDYDGNILMKRHVLVAAPQENYLRIRRSCAGSESDNCQSTSVFYCPDMCHEIAIGGEEESSGDDKAAGTEDLTQAAGAQPQAQPGDTDSE